MREILHGKSLRFRAQATRLLPRSSQGQTLQGEVELNRPKALMEVKSKVQAPPLLSAGAAKNLSVTSRMPTLQMSCKPLGIRMP